MKILLLEGDDQDAELFINSINKASLGKAEIHRFSSLEQALPAMKSADVIVADLNISDSSGFSTIEKIYKTYPTLPLIVLSGNIDSDHFIQAVSHGAHDYLVKGVIPTASLYRCMQSAIIRKKLEVQLIQNTENKSAFLSRMSHEIRTPLNVVLGLLDHLIEESPRKDQVHVLETAIRAGGALKELINDILDLSKVEAGKMSLNLGTFNLHHLLQSCRSLFLTLADDKEIELRFKQSVDLPLNFIGDVLRIQQILTNLIGNSIKFTQEGFVELQADYEELQEGERNRHMVKFTITDTGCGMTAEQLKKLFTPFEQADSDTFAKFGGTGLGLSITKELSDMMGGTIKASSTVGAGSVFEVILPLTLAQEQVQNSLPTQSDALDLSVLEGKKVLVVEDDKTNQIMLKYFFHKLPFEFCFASDGDEAIALLKEKVWDIVLLDNQIPGPSGVEVLKWIRNNERSLGLKRTNLIAISGDVMTKSAFNEHLSEFSSFIPKPFKKDELLRGMVLAIKEEG